MNQQLVIKTRAVLPWFQQLLTAYLIYMVQQPGSTIDVYGINSINEMNSNERNKF